MVSEFVLKIPRLYYSIKVRWFLIFSSKFHVLLSNILVCVEVSLLAAKSRLCLDICVFSRSDSMSRHIVWGGCRFSLSKLFSWSSPLITFTFAFCLWHRSVALLFAPVYIWHYWLESHLIWWYDDVILKGNNMTLELNPFTSSLPF